MEIKSKKILLWIIPKKLSPKYLSPEELRSAANLKNYTKYKYLHSRSSLREVLGKLFNINPLKVPLNAEFGEIPSIPPKYGYISLSHCDDALLIGWSKQKIGVDIEKIDRKLNSKAIVSRFFFKEEIDEINLVDDKDLINRKVIKFWVLKEASIKFNRGNIAKDLKNWRIELLDKYAFNKSLDSKLNVCCLQYQNYFFGIASEKILIENIYPLICNSL